MRTLPTLAQLRALVAVADHLSFREAARELGVSQPSVSASMSALEALLGTQLARRSSRRVTLTPMGQQVASRARQIAAEVEELVEVAAPRAPADAGPLRLGIIPTVAPYILAPVLGILARRAPQLAPQVTEGQTAHLLDDIAAGELDAAIMALPASAPAVSTSSSVQLYPDADGGAGLAEVPLYQEDFVLLVPPGHRLAGAGAVPTSTLRELPLLLLEDGHCLSGQVLDICRQVGAATNHPARAASLTTIAQLVAAGLGATLLPETALPVETRKGKLAVARFEAPAPGRTIGLVFGRHAAAMERGHHLAELLRRGLDRPGFAGRPLPAPVASTARREVGAG